MSLVERLAEKWLEAQGDDIEPAFDRNRTDSKEATYWWLKTIADELEHEAEGLPTREMHRWNDASRWLRAQAEEE